MDVTGPEAFLALVLAPAPDHLPLTGAEEQRGTHLARGIVIHSVEGVMVVEDPHRATCTVLDAHVRVPDPDHLFDVAPAKGLHLLGGVLQATHEEVMDVVGPGATLCGLAALAPDRFHVLGPVRCHIPVILDTVAVAAVRGLSAGIREAVAVMIFEIAGLVHPRSCH